MPISWWLTVVIQLAWKYLATTVKPTIKNTPKEDNLPTKDNLKVPFYTHSIQNNLQKLEANLPTKDKRLYPKHVHYSEVSLKLAVLYLELYPLTSIFKSSIYTQFINIDIKQ